MYDVLSHADFPIFAPLVPSLRDGFPSLRRYYDRVSVQQNVMTGVDRVLRLSANADVAGDELVRFIRSPKGERP